MQEKPVRLVAELTFTQTIHTKIRGVTFRGAQAVIPLCHVGDDLLLLREKNRPEYPNAIEVRHLQDHLGYISDDLAERLAPVMDAGVEPSATITAITGGGEGQNFGVNIDITISEPFDPASGKEPHRLLRSAMKKLACVLLLLCAVHPALAEEPIKFRGAWIGESVSDYVNCSSAKGKSLREGYKVHGKPCSDKGSVFRTKAKGFMSSKLQGEGFLFQDGKLFRITIYIPNEDWDKVRYDLTEKLGPPAKEVPQVFQNAFGARYEYEQGFWQKGDIVAFGKIKVATLGNEAIKNPFTNLPDTEGIEVTITDAEHAKLPDTLPSTMD